jgi:hypothetical protein
MTVPKYTHVCMYVCIFGRICCPSPVSQIRWTSALCPKKEPFEDRAIPYLSYSNGGHLGTFLPINLPSNTLQQSFEPPSKPQHEANNAVEKVPTISRASNRRAGNLLSSY